MDHYQLSEIIRITGCSKQTARRWQSGQTKPPAAAIAMMQLFIDGNLTALIGTAWADFIAKDGQLFVPGWTRGFLPDELRAMFYQIQLVKSLQNQIHAQEKTLTELTNQRNELQAKLFVQKVTSF